ncbi:MAG: Argininosuccinate synthase [Chloroflexi bacterium ADurb.Bin180]|nr:MAG: Argininosuccinate synthase [Chloroflexi bacterium ADurb.Bin180]HOU23942.1 argininosuccinate synthase [Anaerolineae bacterium]HQJ51252.1 argininosuccinate synthase [Anaerolineae bacterium]
MKGKFNKVVVAYSGGLDTSVIVPWLKENYGCEVITYTADVGQGADELEGLEAKSKASGASKAYVQDLRDEFLREYAFPTMQAGAIYEGLYLLGTSFARPIIAKYLVKVAELEHADAVAHGCTGKGNDQVRFELSVKALNPYLVTIAPWREWELRSREDELAYAAAHNIHVAVTETSIYSRDRNLWHLSHEGGLLEDPWAEPDEDMFLLTVSPEKAPDAPQYITIDFERGVPVAIDGVKMSPVELVTQLNTLGGQHGIGRVDLVENRLVGMKSRGVYETPGGTILYAAHQGLEQICLDRETLHFKEGLAHRYAELVYYGQWFTPLREALDAFVSKTQRRVTGTVRVKLYKGSCTVVGRKSPYSLYRDDFATFGHDVVYDQRDAAGFINLFGLPLKVKALVDRRNRTLGVAEEFDLIQRD